MICLARPVRNSNWTDDQSRFRWWKRQHLKRTGTASQPVQTAGAPVLVRFPDAKETFRHNRALHGCSSHMADDLWMALEQLLRKAELQDPEFLCEGVRVLAQTLTGLEVSQHPRAERPWYTQVGTI